MVKIKNLQVNIEGTIAVDDVSFEVLDGSILGIVGESGSGKTQTALAIAGLLSNESTMSGEIWLDDVCLSSLKGKERREYNGTKISVIFQEPMSSLNPLQKVGRQIDEVLRLHRKELNAAERKERVLKILDEVEIDEPERVYNQYPHELSGGMRQRIVIAIASILRPGLIIADEPTTSLDSETAKSILALLMKLNKKYNRTILFISHDLKVVRELCSEVLVMQGGKIVERGNVDAIFENPKEEYTKKLLESAYLKPKAETVEASEDLMLEVKDVSLYYNDKEDGFFGKRFRDYVLQGISFKVHKGQIVGIVGSSGKGKSTLAKAILGLHKEYDGEIICNVNNMQMVFQDPFDSLNPSMKVGDIIAEPLRVNHVCSRSEIKPRVIDMLEKVGLSAEYYDRMPDELSGGQRQRVSIALSLIGGCKFIVADEPCSALDVTVQKQVMELFLKLQKEMGLTILLISHDAELIGAMCDEVVEL
ncbi:MAG: ABC transporter ATP-binding protein [Lachnospiraceae bacterium]|nr:ABC transporter ATP-binding protein [Lachnospiraceae bacterium]